ncbi:MAG: nuclear transport factor 2 family protein [Actinobacteria bacterium]|nr:nuclear transport factor 2 family protein [Actinomycetota bacterium]
MNEDKNVAIITKIYEAFGKGDIPYILAQLQSDVRWVAYLDAHVPTAGDWSGQAKVPGFFQAIGDNMDVVAFTPGEFVSQGDTVVSMGDFDFKVRATGKSAKSHWIFVWKLRDGKVSSYEQFHSPEISEAFR